jgi:uncharacterized DUF497 family protein
VLAWKRLGGVLADVYTLRIFMTDKPLFEWDPVKRERNLVKHGVDFLRAIRVFNGRVLWRPDTRQPYGEIRLLVTGETDGLILTLVVTPRGTGWRIISARKASTDERSAYRGV